MLVDHIVSGLSQRARTMIQWKWMYPDKATFGCNTLTTSVQTSRDRRLSHGLLEITPFCHGCTFLSVATSLLALLVITPVQRVSTFTVRSHIKYIDSSRFETPNQAFTIEFPNLNNNVSDSTDVSVAACRASSTTTKMMVQRQKDRIGKGKKLRKDVRPKNEKVKKLVEPIHWVQDTDAIVFDWPTSNQSTLHDEQSPPALIQFTVRGNPLPLRRHRTSRGFVYNPSSAAQKSFREIVEAAIYTEVVGRNDTKSDNECSNNVITTMQPIYDAKHTLAMSIIFRMRRPKIHFISGKPGPGRLRESAPKQSCSNMRTDVDNLAKFVLDSLNGLVYEDDRQIVSLHVTKLYDNDTDELCKGSTCVCLRLLSEDDLPQLLSNSFDLY